MTLAAWIFAAIVAAAVLGTEYFCWRTGCEVRSLQRRTEASLDRIGAKLKEAKKLKQFECAVCRDHRAPIFACSDGLPRCRKCGGGQ